MAKGSCLCGKLKYEFTGEPVQKLICHCLECRKITGTAFSMNLLVPKVALKMDGDAKHYTLKQELGDYFTTTFCGDCGTTICKQADIESMKDMIVVEGGTLDELEGFDNVTKPGAEFFTKYRAGWLKELEGAAQIETAPQ